MLSGLTEIIKTSFEGVCLPRDAIKKACALTLGLAGGLDLPMLLVLMSTVVWVVGILQLRTSLRIWGLVDLVAALLCSIVFSSSEIVQSDKMFLGMIVLAAELGIVAWLGLANQEDLSKD